MLTNIQDINCFSPKSKDVFLFDTNILIKIFYSILGTRNSKPYINLYKKIREVNATLLISSIQLSEFVNCCIRFQYDLYKNSFPEIDDFKRKYRNTDDYRQCMNAILETIEVDIFPYFVRVNDNFESLNSQNLLLYSFSYDFNDAFLAEISRFQNAFLVTEDADYANYLKGLNIITANPKLLMFKSRR